MRSTTEHPLAFFDWYLENEIHKDLKEFYINITEELHFNNVDKIDKLNHIVKVLNIHFDQVKSEYITFSFEGSVKGKLNQEVKQAKEFIELGFQERFSDKKEVKAYADFLRIKLNSFFSNSTCKEFTFLPTYFEQLESLINQYSKQATNYSYTSSFVFIAETPKEQLTQIKTLYKLLNEKPSIINCTKEEFINAFTGNEVDYGINWLITGKNKNFVSKPSLLYFLDELINNDFLSRSIINDLYKFIRYVFRDHKGNELKNLKQSREAMSDNPASKDRIDTIISSL
ncbi:hypothetical protein DI383_08430 [Flavobacteriaceae bacterium LYZ1037]|nr:hypothetical protein DI383_08430 [Flavobacteriaceae bacterium LYZ1037]